MDHLPSVIDPHRPILVPYLGDTYDGQAFASFPDRRNWDVDSLHRGDLQDHRRGEAAAFLQAWLYFGLLHHLLEAQVTIEDFVKRDEDGLMRITTEKLPQYMREWKDRVLSYTPVERAAYGDRIYKLLEDAHDIWLPFEINRFCSADANPMSQEISLSIKILVSTFKHSVRYSDTGFAPDEDLPWPEGRSAFLQERMRNDGWCPTVIMSTQFAGKAVWQYYATLLRPLMEDKNHTACEEGGRGCSAMNVDKDSYKREQVTKGCKCAEVGPNVQGLLEILDGDMIPLLRIDKEGETINLAVVPYEKGLKYTAISHVWSDGLGNPETNTLPRCQVSLLADRLSALPPIVADTKEQPLLFWMDTFCVPVKGLAPQSRRTAIKKMADTYEQCSRVLVLDKGLTSSSAKADCAEIFTRISLSNWTRRIWTLQEGVLAPDLYFQFDDRAFHIHSRSSLMRSHEKKQEQEFWNDVGYYSNDFNFDWNFLKHFSPCKRIVYAWKALNHRTTSYEEDVPICLATLLRVEEKYIERLLTEEDCELRVKLWWDMHRVDPENPAHAETDKDEKNKVGIPACVLFLPGRKLEYDGFRWAPASLVDCVFAGSPFEVMGHLHPETKPTKGLAVQLDGIEFSYPQEPGGPGGPGEPGEPGETREPGEPGEPGEPRERAEPRETVLALALGQETVFIRQNLAYGSPSWQGLDLKKLKKLAVLLGRDPVGERALGGGLLGALCQVLRTEDDGNGGRMVVVRYLRMVSVIPKDSYHDLKPRVSWSTAEKEEKERERLQANFGEERRWLVT